MPWWILAISGVAILAICVARPVQAFVYEWRHAKHVIQQTELERDYPQVYGSMTLDEERTYLARAKGVITGTGSSGMWEPKQELINGHKRGCLVPEGDHHWTACPEEDDWPDDDENDDPGPLPDMLAARPAETVVDTALAFAAQDPEDAGWTDQLLADLHEAPTVLDEVQADAERWGIFGPLTKVCAYCDSDQHSSDDHIEADSRHTRARDERLANTGEIEIISQRADYAADLRAQDDDAAEYISRLASDAAQFRLAVHGL